jgi:hypothetical protein
MIACTRAAIEMNEFMSLLTSLEGRRRNDHATKHESGMGFASSWVQCENTVGLCLGDLSGLLLKCRVLMSGECIIDILHHVAMFEPLLPSLCSMLIHEQLMSSFDG